MMNSQTGALEITGLKFETIKALEDKAKKSGKTVEEYARELIEWEVTSGETSRKAARSQEPSGKTEARQQEVEEWLKNWKAMAEEIGRNWQGEQRAVETLLEMRR